jgi:gliding motility-associated protein GldM
MAGGGKETPRQKMIGMMYLVLTALLALQVSNAVLDKFIFIDSSLKQSVEATRDGNNRRIQAIEAQVEKRGGKPNDKAILDKANLAHTLTNDMIAYIEDMRTKIIEITGGYTEDGKLVGGKDYDAQMAYTIGPEGKKNGRAYELRDKLNEFVAKLAALDDSLELKPIALDAKDIPIFANDKNQKNKDFAYLNFENTPTVACMAILSQFQSEVANMEAKALEELAKKVGADEMRFDKIIPVVSADSRVVAAGTKYRAEMFLAASSSTARPVMTYNGSEIKVEDGKGIIEFTANASNYDAENKSKQTWRGTITFNTPLGDTTLTIETEFIVAKPVIQVRSGSVSALFLNCGNPLQIDVPALGASYEPSFRASGAEVIPGAKKGLITVVPNANEVNLDVFSSGNKLGTENFKVKRIPNPTVKAFSRGKPIDFKNGVTIAQFPRSIEVKAIPEPGFAEFLPNDARYRVTAWEVTLARGKRGIGTKQVSGESVDITDLAGRAQAGDRIIIEVKDVKRRNFKDQIEDVKGVNEIFTIPIN